MPKPKSTHFEMVRDHVMDRMRGAKAELTKLQPVPLTSMNRPDDERRAFYKMLLALPKDIRQDTMQLMAERAGHQGGEAAPCSLCQFVASGVPDVAAPQE